MGCNVGTGYRRKESRGNRLNVHVPWPQSSWSVLVSVLVSVIEILNSVSVGGQNFQLLLYILVMFCTLYILWPSLSTAFMAFGL